ncbi:MAG: SMC-Scp complex subunit ScpB [Chitinophagaceae bacterium]
MDVSTLIPHIEALIFASDKPLSAVEITDLSNNAFGFMDDKVRLDQVEEIIQVIIEKYNTPFYPFEMKESGGGWQFLTKKDYHKTVAQLNGEKFLKRLSSASLETLAIIAYKQPITKGEIEAIRGVNSDYSIQKLLEKELVLIIGRNEELPGKPLVYATSKNFMDYFGINSPDDLPKIREVFSSQATEPTLIRPQEETGPELTDAVTEGDGLSLVVRGNGELIEEPDVVVDEDTEAVDPGLISDGESAEPAQEINREAEQKELKDIDTDSPNGDDAKQEK